MKAVLDTTFKAWKVILMPETEQEEHILNSVSEGSFGAYHYFCCPYPVTLIFEALKEGGGK